MLASEGRVYRTTVAAAMVLAGTLGMPQTPGASSPASGEVTTAELTPAAVAAWQQYERQVDGRYSRLGAGADPFFVQDAFKKGGWRQQAMGGQVSMSRIDSVSPGAGEPSIPDARVHHWVGAVFIPGATVDSVLQHLRDRAGRESESYSDVIASKLLSRDGDRIRVYMKLRRDNIITVTYNTEHSVEYRRLGDARASSRSVATKIAEIADAGTARERERPVGDDHGFLWRLNAYWRYELTGGGVLIECESVSLSRSVPMLLRPFVTGTVERIARESLERTLVSLRKELTGNRKSGS
jgi:hypothetical protein